jgi:hypothetical protein
MKTVSWFSAGVSSAVATKLALKQHPDLEILYIHIDDQHPDTLRFVNDCGFWFNKSITVLKSRYSCVDHACRAGAYINGVAGAKCTDYLKRRVRKEWERENNPTHYVWGFDCSSRERESKQDIGNYERI